jgi:hypothetical protein
LTAKGAGYSIVGIMRGLLIIRLVSVIIRGTSVFPQTKSIIRFSLSIAPLKLKIFNRGHLD